MIKILDCTKPVCTAIIAFAFASASIINSDTIIKKSCDLTNRTGDTLIVEGIYSVNMEYSSFHTLEKDSCYNDFQIELELSAPSLDKDIVDDLYQMAAWNTYRQITIKGILEKRALGYGHLGTNNAQIKVLEIKECSDLKFYQKD